MRKKRPPDHESVVEITKRYAAIEGKLRAVILEPGPISLDEHKERITEATKAAEASLAKANKRFADSLSDAYKAGTRRAENAAKKASPVSQRRQDDESHTNTQGAKTGGKKAFKAVRRGAFIDLQNGMTGALSKLRKTVSETVRDLDNKNRNLWEFTRAIEGKLRDGGLLEVEYKNGAHIRLDHYAKMLARSSRIETENVGMFDAAERLGTDLVKCVGQSPTCELCATYRDRVYSVSGKDKRFPALRGGPDSPLKEDYHTIHPNCRCEFIPWFEEIEGPEETKKAIAFSNRPFKDSRTKRERDEYAAWQAGNRQLLTEQAEYDKMVATLGDEMPYKSLGSFRRARRDKSHNYIQARELYRERAGLTKRKKGDIMKPKVPPKVYTSKQEADDQYRARTAAVWEKLSHDEQLALWSYTFTGYVPMNEALRGSRLIDPGVKHKIIQCAKAIDKSVLPEDVKVFRITHKKGLAGLLGCGEEELDNTLRSRAKGCLVTDQGFFSTSLYREDKLLRSDFVSFEITIPAGSKGIYAEPFSFYGSNANDGLWDGQSKKEFGDEMELLLQCGGKYMIKSVTYDDDGKPKIEMELIEQGGLPDGFEE